VTAAVDREGEIHHLAAWFVLQTHADGVCVAQVGGSPLADGGGTALGLDAARAALVDPGSDLVVLDATGLTVIARAMARAAETGGLP